MEQWPGEFWMRRREEGPISALSSRPEARGVMLWEKDVSDRVGREVGGEGKAEGDERIGRVGDDEHGRVESGVPAVAE
jgi:hypothetical protein